jgi:hypothetical protein
LTATALIDDRFPKLASSGYGITSAATESYNCVAWVLRDIAQWWAPDLSGAAWMSGANGETEIEAYIALFSFHGFERCDDDELVESVEKIAIYGDDEFFDHVAFQLPDGRWSSKLGELNDIKHDTLDGLAGSGYFEYSEMIQFMQRPREPHQLAETGLLLPN